MKNFNLLSKMKDYNLYCCWKIMLLIVLVIVFILIDWSCVVREYKFYLFKKNGWSFVAQEMTDCVCVRYLPEVKMLHIEKGFCVKNKKMKNKKIFYFQEENTNKLIVSFENIPSNQIKRFIVHFNPDVLFIVRRNNVVRVQMNNE